MRLVELFVEENAEWNVFEGKMVSGGEVLEIGLT